MVEINNLPPVIFLMGPTASGKTDVAVRLVEKLPCEIVSVDSALVYRGMDIGTAKPDAELLARAPHRLIDVCDPAEPYSAARFRQDALHEIDEIHAAGRIPLLVGGTMLYFRALEQGLSELPAADPVIRAHLDEQLMREGSEALHAELAKVDPVSAARIHHNDPQRIQRALEIFLATGSPMSELWEAQRVESFPFHLLKIALAPLERSILHERIALRFKGMLEQGLVEEVRRFFQRGDLSLDLPAMRAVGYRQVWAYLAGEYDYATMVQKGIVATRQLAKRQLTWLRSDAEVHWLDAQEEKMFEKLLNLIERERIL